MQCTPTKQETSDFLGKMSSWCLCKEHTFLAWIWFTKIKFIILLFEIWPFLYKTIRCFAGCVILRNRPLKFAIPIVLDMTGCKKCTFFVEKCLKSVRNCIHRKIMVCKKTKISNRQISYFSPLCQLQLYISQNRPVRLVSQFCWCTSNMCWHHC